jgi:hypothetical protein
VGRSEERDVGARSEGVGSGYMVFGLWNSLKFLGTKKAENTLAVFRPTSTYENNPFGKGC